MQMCSLHVIGHYFVTCRSRSYSNLQWDCLILELHVSGRADSTAKTYLGAFQRPVEVMGGVNENSTKFPCKGYASGAVYASS